MRLWAAAAIVLITAVITPYGVRAQETAMPDPMEESRPLMDFSGVAYIWWQDDMSNEPAGQEKGDHFSINRVYLTWAKKFTDVWSVRLTTDVDSSVDANKVYFKFAYVQMKQDLEPVAFNVQYGLVATPVLGMIDKLSDARWIYNNYIDKASDLVGATFDPTADMGARASIEVLKRAALTFMYSNGEGYMEGFSEKQGDTSKAYYGMLSGNPIGGLHAAVYYKKIMNGSRVVNRFDDTTETFNTKNYNLYYGAFLAWSDETFKVGVSYSLPKIKEEEADAGDGATFKFSILDSWINLNLDALIGSPVLLYGRYALGENKDGYTYDSATGAVTSDIKYTSTLWAAGIGFKFNSYVQMLIMYEEQDKDKIRDRDQTIWVKTEARF